MPTRHLYCPFGPCSVRTRTLQGLARAADRRCQSREYYSHLRSHSRACWATAPDGTPERLFFLVLASGERKHVMDSWGVGFGAPSTVLERLACRMHPALVMELGASEASWSSAEWPFVCPNSAPRLEGFFSHGSSFLVYTPAHISIPFRGNRVARRVAGQQSTATATNWLFRRTAGTPRRGVSGGQQCGRSNYRVDVHGRSPRCGEKRPGPESLYCIGQVKGTSTSFVPRQSGFVPTAVATWRTKEDGELEVGHYHEYSTVISWGQWQLLWTT